MELITLTLTLAYNNSNDLNEETVKSIVNTHLKVDLEGTTLYEGETRWGWDTSDSIEILGIKVQ